LEIVGLVEAASAAKITTSATSSITTTTTVTLTTIKIADVIRGNDFALDQKADTRDFSKIVKQKQQQ
jgi:hypothetical protein